MSQAETLVFEEDSSGPVVVPVIIAGEKFEIREANGDAACHYRNAILDRTTMGPDGRPTAMKNLADVEPILVSLCLYHAEGPQAGKRVHIDHVRNQFKPKTITGLAVKIKEISELDNEEETIESIDKEIARLEERKKKLIEDQDRLKNAQKSTDLG
jgi:hypothetical protein